MARRKSNEQAQPEAAATQTEAPAAEATPAPAAEADLTAFNAAVEQAVANADTSTGTLTEADVAAVTAEYRKLEGIKAKNAAKKVANEGMKDRMEADDLPGARAYMNISEKALVAAAASGGGTTRTPTDPTEAFVQRVATLQLAYHLVTSSVPEGVDDGWQQKVEELVNTSAGQADAFRAWLTNSDEDKGDAPEVSAVVVNAVKLSEGKSAKAGSRGSSGGGSTYEGPRRDVGAHILNAFADKEEGTFLKIAEIRAVRSEEYGDELPSSGAISARLFPKGGKSTMEKLGIIPTEQEGRKGAVKGTPSE